MTLEIADVGAVDPIEWEETWSACSYATYFQSLEWARVWESYSNGVVKPAGQLVRFSDDRRVVLPFSVRRILPLLGGQTLSSPGGTYGGWLAAEELGPAHAQLLIDTIRSRYPSLRWRINPYNPLEAPAGTQNALAESTQVVDLLAGFDAVHGNWSNSHTRSVRKARKSGVEISLAQSRKDWDEYHGIYLASLQRWGDTASSIYQRHLFDILFDLQSPNVDLWLAWSEGRVVAGALCFSAADHVAYWHGAALSSHFQQRPVHLLMYEIMKNTADRGLRWFDFNPSGDHEGVRKFKEGFGTQLMSCPILVNARGAGESVERLKRSTSTALKKIRQGGRRDT